MYVQTPVNKNCHTFYASVFHCYFNICDNYILYTDSKRMHNAMFENTPAVEAYFCADSVLKVRVGSEF
jgi:hypothetical protein